MRKLLTYLLAGVMAVTLAACGGPKKKTNHLKLAYSPSLCHIPLHIAVEKGFFKAEGIEAENIQVDAAHVQEAIGANQVDLGSGLISKFMQPVENGLPIKFVAGVHTGCIKVLAPKGSTITSIEQLKGKKVGVPGLADAATLILKRALAAKGISVDEKKQEVEFVVFSRNDLPQVLANGTDDVIALNDPGASIAADKLGLTAILDTAKTAPFNEEYCCAIFITDRLAQENPELAAAATRAVLKASAWIKVHPEEAARIQLDRKYVAGNLEQNVRILKAYNYKPSVQGGYDAIKRNIEQLSAIGIIKKGTDAKAFTDRVYLFQKGVPDSYSEKDVADVK
ncbi:MAG: ABC transporter substrate-binding protein [Oxalobacter sp.]|nr:ABC transporter substrate-binding protein [Oxalobacter sp.]